LHLAMKRKIFIILLLILVACVAAGLIYLNKVYLPLKLKAYLTSSLEKTSGYNVQIGSINYHLFKGLVIKDTLVYDKTTDTQNIILAVKEVSFNFLFLPFLSKQKIIIPIVYLRSPYLHLRYQKDGTFNFSRIFSPKEKPAEKKSKFSFFVYKINIISAKCLFEDGHFEPDFSKVISDLNIGLVLRHPAKIAFLMQGDILANQGAPGRFFIKGDFDLLSKEIKAKINLTNLFFTDFNPYLKALPFNIGGGSIDTATAELSWKDKALSVEADISTKAAQLSKKELELFGDIHIDSTLKYTPGQKDWARRINFKLLGNELKGIKYIHKISGLSGEIVLTNDKLYSEGLQLETLGTLFSLSGSIENFTDPYLKLHFESKAVNLENAFALLSYPKSLKLTGTSLVFVDVTGKLNTPPLTKKADFRIAGARFENPFLKQPLANLSGQLIIFEDGAEWQKLGFSYRDTAYESSGELRDFKQPKISLTLTSKDLDLKSDLDIQDRDIRINALKGKYLSSDFDVAGSIDLEDKDNPFGDLNAKLNLKIPDAFGLLPDSLSANLKKIKLNGNLNIIASLSGGLKDYQNWNILAKTTSDLLSIYDLKFTKLSFDLEQREGMLQMPNFNTSSAYSGMLNLSFVANLKAADPTYAIKFNANGIDLSKLKSDIGLKDKDISGLMNIETSLFGEFKNLESLKGLGFVSVKDGRLWQINLFKGLGELFLLPIYEKIVFNNAFGEFEIENKNVSTDNLKMQSPELVLDCRGKIDFDGNLDFTIYSTANKNVIRESVDIRKFITAIVGEISGAIAIKLTGTVKDPKFHPIPMPLDLIKNIKDFILGK